MRGLVLQTNIPQHYTSNNTSELNAIIERVQRTMLEMTTPMLLAASLPYSYWKYAICCAVYIYNSLQAQISCGSHLSFVSSKGYMNMAGKLFLVGFGEPFVNSEQFILYSRATQQEFQVQELMVLTPGSQQEELAPLLASAYTPHRSGTSVFSERADAFGSK